MIKYGHSLTVVNNSMEKKEKKYMEHAIWKIEWTKDDYKWKRSMKRAPVSENGHQY